MSDVPVEGEQQGLDRRALVKRMAIGAFAVPAIVSFQLDSLARAGTLHEEAPEAHVSEPDGAEPALPESGLPAEAAQAAEAAAREAA